MNKYATGMNTIAARSSPWAALLLGVLLFLPACTNEEVIFVERPFFDDPPAGAAGYMGYVTSDPADQGMTVCGECHVGKAAAWVTTAHADAWNTLQDSGHAQEFCEGCHTDNERGNASEEEGGWVATGDPRYYDVQCENCHGPGETHVMNPDATQPLASLAVGVDLDSGCGECHQGSHHGFVEEWAVSPHAQVVGFAAAREECAACHRGQATLIAWGENDDYVEKFSSEPLPVVCGVCHDPHGETAFEHQLRFPVNTNSIEIHLCSKCHNRRPIPDPGSTHGLAPHAPESQLILGSAGWIPPGTPIDEGEIRGTHGTEANPELCATCHLPSFTVEDELTGEFVINVFGHLFNPIPCVDEEGIPLPFPNECSLSPDERSYMSCVDSGCHGTEQAAASALTAASLRMERLVEELLGLLLIVDPNLDGPGGEIDPGNPTFTTAEGAFFNMNLAEHGSEEFGTDNVLGSTTHNPFFMEAILIGSIDVVEIVYADVLPDVAISGTDWKAELQAVLQRAGVM